MKAIILAAGKGSRLYPYSKNKPKCLVELNGKNLLERQLNKLKSCGIKNIVIVGGYCSDKLPAKNSRLYLNKNYRTTNMVSSLYCAIDELNEDVIISYGDIVYSVNLINAMIKSIEPISVAIDLNWKSYWQKRFSEPLKDAETLKMNRSGYIIEIGQKAKNIEDIDGQYIGLMKFCSSGLDDLKTVLTEYKKGKSLSRISFKDAYMTDLLMELITQKKKIKSIPFFDPWVEIDTVTDYLLPETSMRLEFLDGEDDRHDENN